MQKKLDIVILLQTVLVVAALLMPWGCAPKITTPPEAVTSGDEFYAKGDKLFQEKAYDEALTVFNEYLGVYPKGRLADAALMKIGAIYTAKQDWGAARRTYKTITDKYPDSPYVSDAEVAALATEYYDGNYKRVVRGYADMDLTILSEAQKKNVYLRVGDAHWVLGSSAEAASFFALAYLNAPDTEQDTIEVKIREPLRLLSPQELAALIDGTSIPEVKSLLKKLATQFEYNRFNLGCLLPISGRYAGFGQKALKGVELALAVYTDRPDATDVRIIIKDSGGDPEIASRAIHDLVTEDQAAAIIGSIVTAETAAVEAQKMGVPIVTMTQKDRITHIGDYVFRNFFTPQMQVEALVSYCTRELRLDSFAVMYPDEPYGWKFMNLFWDEVIAANRTLVGVEAYDKSLTDFAGPIKKLAGGYYRIPPDPGTSPTPPGGDSNTGMSDEDRYRARMAGLRSGSGGNYGSGSGFDALFIPDAPNKVGLIVPQLAFHDVKTTYLLGTNLWYSPKLMEMAQKYVQGAIIPVGFFPGSPSEKVQNFVATFKETFDETPGFIEAIAYDTTMLLLEATQRADIPNRHALKNLLLNLGVYQGVTGATSFDSDGDVLKKLHLIQVKGENFVELETGDPNLPSAYH